MKFNCEVLRDKGIHPVVNHEDRAINGIVYRQVEYSPEEIVVNAEFFHPLFKLCRPFLLILFKIVTTIKQERQLIVRIIAVAKNSHQVQVKFMKVTVIALVVLRDFFGHFIDNSQWVVLQQVFNFNVIDQVMEEVLFEG